MNERKFYINERTKQEICFKIVGVATLLALACL
jgi:hypothetical protein